MAEDIIIDRSESIKFGWKYYFTGKSCRNGHIDKRIVKSGDCFSCRRYSEKKSIKKTGYNYYKKNTDSGLCGHCPREAAPGLKTCEIHKFKFNKEKYENKKKNNICTTANCKNNAVKGKIRCEYHTLYARDYHIKRYIEKKENGICSILSCNNISEENKSKCMEHLNIQNKKDLSLSRKFTSSKSRAKIKNLEWSLTKEEYGLIALKNCEYCNFPAIQHRGSGLDRKNSYFGYIKENIVSCCRECNVAKSDFFSYEEMKIIGKKIREIKLARLFVEIIKNLNPIVQEAKKEAA